jgi:hypothetical protein
VRQDHQAFVEWLPGTELPQQSVLPRVGSVHRQTQHLRDAEVAGSPVVVSEGEPEAVVLVFAFDRERGAGAAVGVAMAGEEVSTFNDDRGSLRCRGGTSRRSARTFALASEGAGRLARICSVSSSSFAMIVTSV